MSKEIQDEIDKLYKTLEDLKKIIYYSKIYLPYDVTVGKANCTPLFLTVNNFNSLIDNEGYKPLLRPLSEIVKNIEYKGKVFKPVDILGWNSYDHILTRGECSSVSYEYVVQLLKWHFDIFGLIPKGLAIDIKNGGK